MKATSSESQQRCLGQACGNVPDDESKGCLRCADAHSAEIAVFVTRRGGREVLLVHRAPSNGGYWHVVAGGVELGETAPQVAKRELHEETALAAAVSGGVEVTDVRC